MSIVDLVAATRSRIRMALGKPPLAAFDISQVELDATEAPRLAADAASELGRLTFGHEGRLVSKWLHYPDVYERHFSRFRGRPIRMLEIGVFQGGSLEIWRDYFGPEATIFGIDINPECANRVDAPNQVRIGSQADPAFLRSVVAEMGGIDIVLDDGSHIAKHQEASLKTLLPLLASDGVYAIEDMHTAYWQGGYGGGYRRSGTAVEWAKSIVDDMHGWYHNRGSRLIDASQVTGVHFYDSIAVIEKGSKAAPRHIAVGQR